MCDGCNKHDTAEERAAENHAKEYVACPHCNAHYHIVEGHPFPTECPAYDHTLLKGEREAKLEQLRAHERVAAGWHQNNHPNQNREAIKAGLDGSPDHDEVRCPLCQMPLTVMYDWGNEADRELQRARAIQKHQQDRCGVPSEDFKRTGPGTGRTNCSMCGDRFDIEFPDDDLVQAARNEVAVLVGHRCDPNAAPLDEADYEQTFDLYVDAACEAAPQYMRDWM